MAGSRFRSPRWKVERERPRQPHPLIYSAPRDRLDSFGIPTTSLIMGLDLLHNRNWFEPEYSKRSRRSVAIEMQEALEEFLSDARWDLIPLEMAIRHRTTSFWEGTRLEDSRQALIARWNDIYHSLEKKLLNFEGDAHHTVSEGSRMLWERGLTWLKHMGEARLSIEQVLSESAVAGKSLDSEKLNLLMLRKRV